MAVTIEQSEGIPETTPEVAGAYRHPMRATDSDWLWARIEDHIAYRFSERQVVWIVEGPGEWVPPLAPTILTVIERWDETSGWGSLILEPSPLGGHMLPSGSLYRFTGTVGGGAVPAAVSKAFVRLANYLVDPIHAGVPAGANTAAMSLGREGGDSESFSFARSPAWTAKALHSSGAADLLRRYRRVGNVAI